MTTDLAELMDMLVEELTQRVLENVTDKVDTREATATEEAPYRFSRIGDNYSVFNWRRVNTGIYETKAANGLRLSVFNAGRGKWYAQVGEDVLNNQEPVSTKVEAIELVEAKLT